ncbi:MAG: DUF434 domain-containing protein [Candidatus Aminicenantes bacterium]|nr:DUF434 domain-containing protein [Candidatus Aminicenantes bacterium]NIM83776.1 DUF434 domain-containing protein [Candidatus Aminicenantes bacterium]NIN23236.1 DUF434 domain-containing protein [Candidatus Aminicenantes bacterium]NIN46930.1 DUF434 domain-containing protein [Candidatus Aminicenantes bacterium]NIN89852.1 DUF434 domain-containing protein [Candidatus Aminicenantes bacterium]
MKDILTESFKAALKDYLFLRNREYPEKPSMKLVGDRYRLTGIQRIVLFRGITSEAKAQQRKAKTTTAADLEGKELYLDGYNVLFTIMNYMLGKAVFIGNDGILRDAGDYGEIENERIFYKAIEVLMDFIRACAAAWLIIYLDRSVPGSITHKDALQGKMLQLNIQGEVYLVQSADKELERKTGGVIGTSDSEIIDVTSCRVLDTARLALEKQFKTDILDLENLLQTR